MAEYMSENGHVCKSEGSDVPGNEIDLMLRATQSYEHLGVLVIALLKYNLLTIQFTYLKYIICGSQYIHEVVQPSIPQSILKHFRPHKQKPHTILLLPSCVMILTSPRQVLIHFLSMDLPVLEIPYKWNHIHVAFHY